MGTARGAVRIEGLNEMLTALQRLGVEVADLKEPMSAIAKEGARLATGFAPSRSGRLRSSIRGNNAKAKAIVIAGKARTPYAAAVNYGWPRGKRNWAAQPRKSGGWPVGSAASSFMQKADKALGPRSLEMLADGLGKAIRKVGLE